MSGTFTTTRFWAGNPANRRSEFEGGIATLLFEQCPRFCVDKSETSKDLSPGEELCIKNCQDKTYQAFNIHMAIWSKYAANRDPKQDINLSEFVEMDIEAGHDTTGTMGTKHGVHPYMSGVQNFANHNAKINRGLQIDSAIAGKL